MLTRAITKATAATKTPTPTPTATAETGGGRRRRQRRRLDRLRRDRQATAAARAPTHQPGEQDAAILSAPSSPQDAAAVGAAAADGEKAIKAELVQRSPDQAQLTASVGRNGLPATMIAVLVLIAATLVAALVPLIRRRRGFPFRPRT